MAKLKKIKNCFAFFIYLFIFYFRSEKQHMKIPRDIQDAKMLAKVLDRYKDMYYFEVMFGVVVAYILYPFLTKNVLTEIVFLFGV